MSRKPSLVDVAPRFKRLPSATEMFTDRLFREGLRDEFRRRIAERMKELGPGSMAKATSEIRKEMGYQGAKEERQLYADYIGNLHKTSLKVAMEKQITEIREEKKVENFEESVRMLPLRAPMSEELEWVRLHPAMGRGDDDNPTVVTADDILCAPQGKAPSQGAVRLLKHWVKRVDKFFELMMSEQKKMTEESNARSEGAKDVGLDEVERLLAEVRKGVQD
jgi:hypothetical protein